MVGIVFVDEGAERRELRNDIRLAARSRIPLRHRAQPSGERSSSMPACWRMKVTLGALAASSAAPSICAGENLEVESPAIVGKVRDVFLQASDRGPGRDPTAKLVLRVLVPLQLHPQSAHAGIFGQAVELRPHVARPENRHSRRWLAEIRFRRRLAARRRLRPRSASFGPIALHVDGLRHAGAGEIGQIFADQIVAPDRLVGAEDARLHRSVEPRQIAAAPDVVMRVDDVRHAAFSFAISRTLAQMLSIEQPSASRSR